MNAPSHIHHCTCLHCGWIWVSRLPQPPRYCARCKRENWDKPLELRPQSIRRAAIESRRLYPIDKLEVGESMLIKWHAMPNGQPDERRNASIGRCVRQEEQRYNKQFRREPEPLGLRVTRIA